MDCCLFVCLFDDYVIGMIGGPRARRERKKIFILIDWMRRGIGWIGFGLTGMERDVKVCICICGSQMKKKG